MDENEGTNGCEHPPSRRRHDAGVVWCMGCGNALRADPVAIENLLRMLPDRRADARARIGGAFVTVRGAGT